VSRLVAAYLLTSAVALLGPHRPALWPLLAVAHVAVATVLLRLPAHARPRAPLAQWLAGLWPLLVMPLLYAELPLLNQSLFGGSYFDDVIIEGERALFGFEPARELATRYPAPALSETLHGAYLSYYLIIYAPPLLVGSKRGQDALRDAVFTLTLVFLAHYLFFVFLPVEGPRYRFDVPVPADARGPIFSFTHALLEAGSSRGAAFPSSHVGVSVAACFACWRWLRPLAPLVTLLTVGLALGAVYGGFHYAIDVLAGAVLGGALAACAPALRKSLDRSSRP
jgi:membrane-associated phospholipid phosphatase